MSVTTLKLFSGLCFFGGFASILASIGIWLMFSTDDPPHAERFGIFVGLWAPTFFILSDRLDRYAVSARHPQLS